MDLTGQYLSYFSVSVKTPWTRQLEKERWGVTFSESECMAAGVSVGGGMVLVQQLRTHFLRQWTQAKKSWLTGNGEWDFETSEFTHRDTSSPTSLHRRILSRQLYGFPSTQVCMSLGAILIQIATTNNSKAVTHSLPQAFHLLACDLVEALLSPYRVTPP